VKFLLDTNVLSQPFALKPDAGCLRWLEERTEHEVATTSLTVAELWQGIFNLAASDKRRGPLTSFVSELPDAMRVLSFDQRAARKWGEITRRGLDPLPVRDSLIAAIALSRNLTVVTRDLGPFKRAGCRTLNPFAAPQ
jgi:toxin FitB